MNNEITGRGWGVSHNIKLNVWNEALEVEPHESKLHYIGLRKMEEGEDHFTFFSPIVES